MGSFRKQGNKKRGSGPAHGRSETDYFGNPKLPGRKGKKGSNPAGGSDKNKKSPLIQHFFFWVVILSSFMAIFGTFQNAIQSWVLFNDLYTAFGAISYWDATIGWTIGIVVVMCVDMILVA